MPSHSEGPGIWLSVWRFLLIHCLYEQAVKVLARLRRLAWTFAARIGDKYQICLTRSIWLSPHCTSIIGLSPCGTLEDCNENIIPLTGKSHFKYIRKGTNFMLRVLTLLIFSIKANFHFSHYKSMATVSCYSNQSSYLIETKSTLFVPPACRCYMWNLVWIGYMVSEEMLFENVDNGRMTDKLTYEPEPLAQVS